MRRPSSGAVCFSLAVTLFAGGCAASRRPVARTAPAVLPSAAELETALDTRRGTLASLRALAHLRYEGPDETSSSREAIVVSRPDRLRVEVLSVFGSVFLLIVDDGALTAYAPRESTVYLGPASPENLWRYTRLGIGVGDVVDLVLGTPPAVSAEGRVEFDDEAGWVRLSQDLPDGTQIVWFSDAAVPVAVEQRGRDGQVRWHASFVDHEDHGGVAIATDTRVELPPWRRSLEIRLEDVDVNPALDHSVFAFHAPPGSKVVNLDSVVD
jgi:outer membrane lipoprotein-sorting protein